MTNDMNMVVAVMTGQYRGRKGCVGIAHSWTEDAWLVLGRKESGRGNSPEIGIDDDIDKEYLLSLLVPKYLVTRYLTS
jgi:hypothetical protein